MASLAKAVLQAADTEEYDLEGYGPDDCEELANDAFKEPIPCQKMFRCTFVCGGGKKVRQKYSPDLPKFLADALRAVGYTEDKGAALSIDSQGTFKYQHDTGKDLKYVHVYPRVQILEEADTGLRIGGYKVDDMPPEIKCTLCEMDTFKDLVRDKCPTVSQKRALLKALKGVQARFEGFEERLAEPKPQHPLTPEEQELYDGQVQMTDKLESLTQQIQALVDAGKVSKAEVTKLQAETRDKIKKVEQSIQAAQAEGKKTTKLEAGRDAMKEQLDKLGKITPITYKKRNEKEIAETKARIKAMQEQMKPLAAIEEAQAKIQRLKTEQEGWFWAAVPPEDKRSSPAANPPTKKK